MQDQLLVNAGLGRDSPQGGAVVPLLGEAAAGSGENCLARPAPARPAAAPPQRFGLKTTLRCIVVEPNSAEGEGFEPSKSLHP
jgi:hypothetical protein